MIIIKIAHRRLYEQERADPTDTPHRFVHVNYRIIGVISKYETESKITESQQMLGVFWILLNVSGQELVDNKALKTGRRVVK